MRQRAWRPSDRAVDKVQVLLMGSQREPGSEVVSMASLPGSEMACSPSRLPCSRTRSKDRYREVYSNPRQVPSVGRV